MRRNVLEIFSKCQKCVLSLVRRASWYLEKVSFRDWLLFQSRTFRLLHYDITQPFQRGRRIIVVGVNDDQSGFGCTVVWEEQRRYSVPYVTRSAQTSCQFEPGALILPYVAANDSDKSKMVRNE